MKTESLSRERLVVPVTEHDHIHGPIEAPITLVEYGDYECPACGEAYWVLKAVQRKLGDQLRLVFRNYPLTSVHPHAEHAAEAAEAAAAQRRFWLMHDLMFENQDALNDEDLEEFAGMLGLDVTRVTAELESGTFFPRVREDVRGAIRSGVDGTPTFFIDGVRYGGPSTANALVTALTQPRGKNQ